MQRSPNRIGIFATFVSFLSGLIGAALLVFAPSFGESTQKTIGSILFFGGAFGILFGYVTVRLFFWATLPKSEDGYLGNEQDFQFAPSPKGETKKWAGYLVTAAIFGVAFLFVRPLGSELRSWLNQPDWAAESLKLKKSLGLPKRLDALTTVVDAAIAPNQTTYWHRLDPVENLDVQALERNIRKGVCGNPSLAEDVRKGVTFSYRYADSTNKPVATINISSCP